MGRPAKRLYWQRFGSVTVVGRILDANSGAGIHARWLCVCDCGANLEASTNQLLQHGEVGCHCKFNKRELHGEHSGRTYNSWQAMIQRCTNPKFPRYKNWGGRGVRVCDRWMRSFANFRDDMGQRPVGTSLDRYPNNDGNYEPGNCRWATAKEQANNTRPAMAARARASRSEPEGTED